MGLAAFLLLAGCSGAKTVQGTPIPVGQSGDTFAPPITIVLADGSSRIMEYETVAAMPLQTLDIAGRAEHGPTLASFLDAAGVTGFNQVVFTGLENRTLTFTPDQLTDEYILALRSKSKAVNLMSPNLTEEQWVLHVFRVEVK
jgi:hypothetical protein